MKKLPFHRNTHSGSDTERQRIAAHILSTGIVPTDQLIDQFIRWRISEDWQRFKQSVMDKELLIKNQIEALTLVLPNAKKGVAYSAMIEIDPSLADNYTITGLTGSGLTASETIDGKCVISGTPIISGDWTLDLNYHCTGFPAADATGCRKLRLSVNPDPRELWKNIATSTDIEFYRPDSDCDYKKVEERDGIPQKDIVAASQRGRSHAHEGKPRDDDFKIFYDPNSRWYIMAVADGAGSAKFSRKGAEIAVTTAVETCREMLAFPEDFENKIASFNKNAEGAATEVTHSVYQIVGNAALKAKNAIASFQKIERPNDTVKDFSTTLLLTICKRFEFGWFIASFWVGDGAIAIYNRESRMLKLLGEPDGGEYAGQTRFLTMDSVFADPSSLLKRLRFTIVPDFTALMLMTDGVSDAKFETDANLGRIEKWDEFWDDLSKEVHFEDDNEESRHELLKWLDFWSTGNHDDRTIAILY